MKELMEKIIAEFNANGIEFKKCNYNQFTSDIEGHRYEKGFRNFYIEEVHRHNGTDENKNCKIEVTENLGNSCAKRIGEVRVNVNASGRVIKNRVKKIMEIYKG